VTQHGSFPDRPRGRRARHGSDSQWQSSSEGDDPRAASGRDAIPSDDREFPDLEPIRGRRLSDSDNRGLPNGPGPNAPGLDAAGGGLTGRGIGRRGRHSGPIDDGPGVDGFPGMGAAPGGPGGGAAAAPWREAGQPAYGQPSPVGPDHQQYGQYGQRPDQQPGTTPRFGGQPASGQPGGRPPGGQSFGPGQQFGDPQYGGQQPGPRGYEQPEQFGGQSYPGQPDAGQPATRRKYRQERAAAGLTVGGGGRRGTQLTEDPDEITDDPMEAFSERWARRGAEDGGGRRRPRLMWLIGGAGVLVVAVAVVVYFLLGGRSNSGSVGFGSLVTTFLPGEVQTVPDACNVVSAATISQYMPGGQPDVAEPPLNGGQDSQCTWTLDNPPTYRVIEVDVNAFSPSGLASGDGSATFAAEDAYASDLQTLKSPTASSGQPKAVITDLAGLGDTAFSATQIFNTNGATTYKATVIVRYHNVVVTSVVNGLYHAVTKKGTYGPVSMSTLSAAAQTAASQAVAHLHA
jgi:hypothetical protein